MTPSSFTQQLWEAARPVYEAILQHPFVKGLADAELPRDRFQFYVVQDSLYLREFARCLAALASRAPDPETLSMLNRHASDSMQVEKSLHDSFLAEFGMHPEQVDAAPVAPSNRAYCDFLLASALGRPFHEGLAAVLPCYWIYQRVGQQLLSKGSPDSLYRRWIETYASDEFDRTVREILDRTDRLAATLTEAQRADMTGRFVTASRYEWMFWDAAWQLQRWPV